MRKYTVEELKGICEKHIKWLRDEEGGERANFQGANLQGANFRGANLRFANFQGANLQDADFWGANLRFADLRGANFQGANFQDANLQDANFQGANLQDADFWGANLRFANLRGANLRGANLDYSCLPLWCGGSRFKADAKIAAQIAAHFCALDCDDPAYIAARSAILEFAKTSHRAGDLGLL